MELEIDNKTQNIVSTLVVFSDLTPSTLPNTESPIPDQGTFFSVSLLF
jgi:hypothetical protein